jgi:hypothetical protein
MTPIEALYQRAPVNPDGAAFIVGDDKWKYGGWRRKPNASRAD